MYKRLFPAARIAALLLSAFSIQAQPRNTDSRSSDSSGFYGGANTYMNPVLAGDHPDPTLLQVGDDFYMCGSSFHFCPYLPILHSTDLIHWQEVSRAVAPDWSGLKDGRPGSGIWQGAITYFYGSYWLYFSNGNGAGQYFVKAPSPAGPWSAPVKVRTTASTGPIGYDNSVFVDEDGTPYMLTKAGKPVNRIQPVGRDGHLTGEAVNLDWINVNGRYSWAEGPVMFKRDGWYYYSFARDVAGGQHVYRTQSLTADSTKWQFLGNFFDPVKDPATGFRVSNHLSAAVRLKDGSWWAIAQSYDKTAGDDWSGQGRQTLLHRINWDAEGRPHGEAATTAPLPAPALPKTGLAWILPRSDYFDGGRTGLSWYFLNPGAAADYSLTDRPGWLTLNPGSGKAHLLQKEAGRYYSLVTKVDLDAVSAGQQAGIYVTNGDETVTAKLLSAFDNGKKIVLELGDTRYEADNAAGNTVWLRLQRDEHELTASFSGDGSTWRPVGKPVSATAIDRAQPGWNHWVGTSIGLIAEGCKAAFDQFYYRDGFSTMPAAGYNNGFGMRPVMEGGKRMVCSTPGKGGWLMIGGVEFGREGNRARGVEVIAGAEDRGDLEIWIDDIGGKGRKVADVRVGPAGAAGGTGTFVSGLEPVTGQHDLYVRFPRQQNAMYLETIRLTRGATTRSIN